MAIDQATPTASDRASRRSYEAIYKSVCAVAKYGFGSGSLRTGQLEDLLWAARIIRYGSENTSRQEADETDNLGMVEYALRHAISSLDDSGRKSAPALLGLTDATRNAPLTERRESARQDGELPVSAESFRIHTEKPLLIELSRMLCQLADERIRNDWEARLKQRESKLKRAEGNGNRDAADAAAKFEELFGTQAIKPSPKAPADIVQTTPTTVVRPSEPEKPATIAEALHVIGGVISNIYQLIMQQCDPGQYRRYVARDPWWRGTYRRNPPPRPVRTSLERGVAIALVGVTLLSICAFLVGTFIIMQFFARLIFG